VCALEEFSAFDKKMRNVTDCLGNFGLKYFESEKHFPELLRAVCWTQRIFYGYWCHYLYQNFGYAEMIVTVWDDQQEKHYVGFNNHKIGNCHWRLRVAPREIIDREDVNPFFFKVVYKATTEIGAIPIRIIHADVVPSFLEDDEILMQVAAFPISVNYCLSLNKLSAVGFGKPSV
jgi:hypothetical protein